jgi:hypothetical protein
VDTRVEVSGQTTIRCARTGNGTYTVQSPHWMYNTERGLNECSTYRRIGAQAAAAARHKYKSGHKQADRESHKLLQPRSSPTVGGFAASSAPYVRSSNEFAVRAPLVGPRGRDAPPKSRLHSPDSLSHTHYITWMLLDTPKHPAVGLRGYYVPRSPSPLFNLSCHIVWDVTNVPCRPAANGAC